jgi:thioredoxin-related protein
MNKTTFCDSAVAEFINKNFYLVELNAESLDTLKLGDKIFPPSSNPGFPFHSLAFELTKKNFILPSTVFMDEKLSIIESVPFYQHPKGISPILKYFGENYYLKFKWDDFLTGLKNGTLNQKEKTK